MRHQWDDKQKMWQQFKRMHFQIDNNIFKSVNRKMNGDKNNKIKQINEWMIVKY